MTFKPIKEFPDLVKDDNSNAILNGNKESFLNFKKKQIKEKEFIDRINNLESKISEIDNLESKLNFIMNSILSIEEKLSKERKDE